MPEGAWFVPLLAGFLIAGLAVAAQEYALATRGYSSTIVDSPQAWARERKRASELGAKALVLVGASRMQLDVHLVTLAELTGKEPVQLAIDGSSFVPVLASLADDEAVKGTILVDYYDYVVGDVKTGGGAQLELSEWAKVRSRGPLLNFEGSETWLGNLVRQNFRSYADGASPLDALTLRVMEPLATPQYLITLPSRERRADYRKVDMPAFYYKRVARTIGLAPPPPAMVSADVDRMLRSHIAALTAVDLPSFDAGAVAIRGMVHRIEARGGRVVFVAMPTSGFVRAAEGLKYPKSLYWDRFIRIVRAPAIHFTEVLAMARLTCPDGSHLDLRDQVTFTRALAGALAGAEK